MTARILDLRLKKLERAAKQTALSHLSDEQLDASIRLDLAELCHPYGGLSVEAVEAAADDLRHSPAREERELVGYLDWLVGTWDEIFPQAVNETHASCPPGSIG